MIKADLDELQRQFRREEGMPGGPPDKSDRLANFAAAARLMAPGGIEPNYE